MWYPLLPAAYAVGVQEKRKKNKEAKMMRKKMKKGEKEIKKKEGKKRSTAAPGLLC